MKVVKQISAIQDISDYYRCLGKKVALVPTMGFLHEGHISLMLKAKDENDILVTSIFVNPAQFSKGEDFDKYPRDITRDYHICDKAGVDYIFNPESEEMYKKPGFTTVTVSDISDKLEGKFRPEHFTGVATIVVKLLNAVKPDYLYLGQKDAQQNVIIKKIIEDLNNDTKIIICQTLREENGLAMSSRNTYLSEDEKNKAAVLYY
ncbi:MAG: pantoate--beta-alanine ligase, partial [Bacteroidetes bacterium]|nr:pantoate--beta-alanine ligase [Bacteroidota bacterium]